MSAQNVWKVERLEVDSIEGLTDVVVNVHWRVFGETGTAYGTVSLPMPTSGDFIPFEELTEEIVIAWAKIALGEESVANAEAAANALPRAPAPTLPWAMPQEVVL